MESKCHAKKVHILEIGSTQTGPCDHRILNQLDQNLMLFKEKGWLLVYSQSTPAIVTVKKSDAGDDGAEQEDDCESEEGVSKKINKNLRPVRFKIIAKPGATHEISIKCCDENGKNCKEVLVRSGPVMKVEDLFSP